MELKVLEMEEEEAQEMETDVPNTNNLVEEIVAQPNNDNPDLSEFTDLIQKLESTSGQKLCKLVINNTKDFCKLTTIVPQQIIQVEQGIKKFSIKCTTNQSKGDKFLHKFSDNFSCEGELFKTILKTGMKSCQNEEGGASLISILTSIFKAAGSQGKIVNPILGIQMLLSHSKAEDIFLELIQIKGKPKKKIIKDEDILHDKFKYQPKPADIKAKFTKIKAELLKLWLVLVESFVQISKLAGTENDKKILENSVPYLMQMYNATLSSSDQQIFSILKLYSSKKLQISIESLPLFGPKCFEAPLAPNPLYAHSIRANTILSLINDTKAFETSMKLEEEDFPKDSSTETKDLEQYYDLRFILPLVCHCLDEKNICDVVKVIMNGWIYFIVRGLSLQDPVLRSISFLAYKRLIFNLHLAKGFRLQDVKIWLHFLLAVKKGLSQLTDCQLSSLVSTWIVATCEVLKQPTHPMYSKVTHFLLAKPVIDLTILPDFIPFFNAVDGNKESREWILNILLQGLRTPFDWAIARKVPTLRFMCSSFFLEKITTQRTILKIMANGAKIPEVAQDMVDRHSLLLWVANVPIEEKYYKREMGDIYRNLSQNCPQGGYRNKVFKFVASKQNWTYCREEIISSVGLSNGNSENGQLIKDDSIVME